MRLSGGSRRGAQQHDPVRREDGRVSVQPSRRKRLGSDLSLSLLWRCDAKVEAGDVLRPGHMGRDRTLEKAHLGNHDRGRGNRQVWDAAARPRRRHNDSDARFRQRASKTTSYRMITFTRLSETADVALIDYGVKGIKFTFQGKYLGGRKDAV